MRKLLVVCAALVAAACVFAGASAADSPTTVSIVGCTLLHGGNVTVPAGSTINLRFSWVARTAGLDRLFEKALDLNVSVDGASVASPGSYWGDPFATITSSGTNGFQVNWLYATGITLQSGDSLTFVWNGVLSHPVTDGLTPGSFSGDIFSGHDTCTVTAG
jgi:hypothetical protein